ncbi:Glutathione S-transferase L3 [Linum perenne]
MYTNYQCPYAQRTWITRNFKGLQDKIKLVPLDLQNRPAWYPEKVYAGNKVPALEHDGKIIGESLDLVKYLDSNFEGPSLLPDDPAKKQFAEEMFAYTDTFNGKVFSALKGDAVKEAVLFQVDIAYVPFIERFQIFLSEVFKYDIAEGRPNLAAWIEEMNKLEAYKQTKLKDPKQFVELYSKRFLVNNLQGFEVANGMC